MIEAGQVLPLVVKIGVLIGAILIGLLAVKLVSALLVSIFHWSSTDTREAADARSGSSEPANDPLDENPGLHVLSEFGDDYRFAGASPTDELIRETLRSLDWEGGFHQVFLVTSPGVSLEVGGSLDPQHGLSSVYRDSKNDLFRVTKEPPTTVRNMEDLLVSFNHGDGKWERMYRYH